MIVCPKCKNKLERIDNTYKCVNNHSYDISRDGYVNLLINQTNSGDNKEMVNARFEFLNNNYYLPLAASLVKVFKKYLNKDSVILDSGCGTGYYFNIINKEFNNVIGYDISSIAIKKACKLNKDKMFFVGNMNSIPLLDKSVDLSFHVFSPFNELEEARILKKDGYLVLVNPGRDHLYELKRAIYDDAYYNSEGEKELDKFKLIDQINVKYNIDVVNKDILNLVKMTPYFYKTKDSDIERLNNINSLNITCDFNILIYLYNNK